MDVTAVIWDWNGTLLDDVAFSAALLNRQLARHGCAPLEGGLDAYRRVFRFPIEAYYRDAGFDLARTPYSQLAEEYMAIYEPESRDCPLQPHARAALEGLRTAGLTQVVLSASEKTLLLRQLDRYGLGEDVFAEVLGLSDILGRSKAEMGRAWMEQSHVDPARAVMVGDSVHDWEVARAMGTACVLYSGGHQARAALEATGAPVIDDLLELLDLVK